MTEGHKRGDNSLSVNMVCPFILNHYFHCCYRCCFIKVNELLIFFSAFLDLQSIRDDEAIASKQLIFLIRITSQKKKTVENAQSGQKNYIL